MDPAKISECGGEREANHSESWARQGILLGGVCTGFPQLVMKFN